MVILSNNDMFEVRLNSLLADYDRDTLANLYQPIIGYTALAIYFTLWSEASIQKVLSFSSHDQLFTRMKIAPGHFIDARKVLEAVGLLKTRLEKAPGTNIYHYELSAPKTPKGFFSDTLLFGMLIKELGENDANRLKKVYEISDYAKQGEDISSSFNEIFHPDFRDSSFIYAARSQGKETMGREKGKVRTTFSYEKFFESLSQISQINEKGISKKEIKEIERIALLYGVDEEEAAHAVASSYDVSHDKGERVDLDNVGKLLMDSADYSFVVKKSKTSGKVSAETNLGRKIKLFEEITPFDLLKLLQNGTMLAPSDIKIIQTLSEKYRLNNSVINVIIDFILSTNNNVLSKAYAEKIAASFAREGIETALDAMNYCNEVLASKKGKGKSTYIRKNKVSEVEEEKKDEINEEEWDDLFQEKEKGEKDGTPDTDLPF